MSISHPWSCIPRNAQARLFTFTLVVTVVVLLALQILGAPLRTDAAPAGIISYELAGDLTTVRDILVSWGAEGQTYAGVNLGLDYLFLFAYSTCIGLACVLVGHKFNPRSPLQTIGVLLSWGLVLAAILDAIENYALLSLLLGSAGGILPALARAAAVGKFLLVILGILFAVIAGSRAVFYVPRNESSGA